MNVKQSLQRLLATEGAPRMIRWGIHEGIRGARWITLYADGRLDQQRYDPNPEGALAREDVSRVPRQHFEDVVLQISNIEFDVPEPSTPLGPNQTSVSLECLWDETRCELAIASDRLEDIEGLVRLSETFRMLAEEATSEGGSDPDGSLQQ